MSVLDVFQNSILPLEIKSCMVAILCGFIIGIERQIKGKPAGIRTSILVCLGAYTFVVISASFQNEASPSRVIGQVVSGIGFLGAGLILAKDGLIHGVTSAAVIWLLAGIGCLIGVHKLEAALFLTFMSLFILVGVTLLEKLFKRLRQGFYK
jgi:putative Mg2+ transporter-C (MgtC) family protein